MSTGVPSSIQRPLTRKGVSLCVLVDGIRTNGEFYQLRAADESSGLLTRSLNQVRRELIPITQLPDYTIRNASSLFSHAPARYTPLAQVSIMRSPDKSRSRSSNFTQFCSAHRASGGLSE